MPEAGVAGVAHEGAELFFGCVETIAATAGVPGASSTVDDVVRILFLPMLVPHQDSGIHLVGLVLIMDSRRPLLELYWQMIEWFAPSMRPIHCLLTKADKLTRQEQTKILRDVREQLAPYEGRVTAQLFSSLKKTGMEEAEKIVGSWLTEDGEAAQREAEPE